MELNEQQIAFIRTRASASLESFQTLRRLLDEEALQADDSTAAEQAAKAVMSGTGAIGSLLRAIDVGIIPEQESH